MEKPPTSTHQLIVSQELQHRLWPFIQDLHRDCNDWEFAASSDECGRLSLGCGYRAIASVYLNRASRDFGQHRQMLESAREIVTKVISGRLNSISESPECST